MCGRGTFPIKRNKKLSFETQRPDADLCPYLSLLATLYGPAISATCECVGPFRHSLVLAADEVCAEMKVCALGFSSRRITALTLPSLPHKLIAGRPSQASVLKVL